MGIFQQLSVIQARRCWEVVPYQGSGQTPLHI
jgi:hypothetical protein